MIERMVISEHVGDEWTINFGEYNHGTDVVIPKNFALELLKIKEEVTRLKAENAELKESQNSIMCVYCGFTAKKDANVMADHVVFECEKRPTSIVNMTKVLKDVEGFEKSIQELTLANELAEEKIARLTTALAKAHEALEPFATLTEYDVMSAPVAVGWLTNAKKALADKDGSLALERWKRMEDAIRTAHHGDKCASRYNTGKNLNDPRFNCDCFKSVLALNEARGEDK